MADRIENERRAAHEMELARQVQSKLLPEQPPSLLTLECAARCVQARAVGGDYYDFLELGPGRTGLVIADISGKGFPAALVMASLQASLRSRLAQDMLDLPRQLGYVNQLLYRTSESNRYATLFLGLMLLAARVQQRHGRSTAAPTVLSWTSCPRHAVSHTHEETRSII